MPRSGTSLSASIFARKGYFAAEPGTDELRSGDEFNPDGYFEAETLVEANVRILERAGFPRHNTWLYEPITDEQAAAIDDLERLADDQRLLEEMQPRSPWMWKDPRLCYTLTYWWPMIAHDSTSILITRREHTDIWNSFVRLGWREDTRENQADVYQRIDAHLCTASAAIAKYQIPHIEINYEEYHSDPENTARKLSETFGLPVDSGDLGFRSAYNHSGFRGSTEQFFERLAGAIPDRVRLAVKKIVPHFVVRALFPSRRS
jgi:hypothetical protein